MCVYVRCMCVYIVYVLWCGGEVVVCYVAVVSLRPGLGDDSDYT